MKDGVKDTPTLVDEAERVSTLIADAGLTQTAALFPDDVAVAMATAEKARKAMAGNALSDVTAEPWPAMRMRGAA